MLRVFPRRLLSIKLPVTHQILEASQIADWIIEQIQHSHVDHIEGKCEAASYDISGNCWKYFNLFSDKIKNKDKLIKMMENRSEFIHLDDSNLNDFDALIVSKILKYNSPSIKLLDLNNNPDLGDAGLSHVSKYVLNASSPVKLRSLFASGCSITDEGVHSLVTPLRHPEQTLHILELRKNEISDDGVELMAEILSKPSVNNPDFTLFLNSNKSISVRGAVALAKAVVESNGRLKVWLKDTCLDLSEDDKKEIMRFTKNHVRF
jgi:hypothetical protein